MKDRSLLLLLTSLLLVAAGGCNFVLESIEQNYLFRPWNSDPARLALVAASGNGIEEVKIPAPDGVTLHGWLKPPTAARPGERFPLVIVFGGVRREVSWMIERTGSSDHWGWLFMNYRGFGLSGGYPSERVILEDSRTIYDYAASRADVDPQRIAVLGRSLGTYFTVALARSRSLRGAILATPFDSMAAVGAELYPWLPLGLMLNGRYDAAAIAPTVKTPALFVLAENDDVTPVANGASLARAWGGPQRTVTLAGARHYGIERRPEFWSAVNEFLRELESLPARGETYAGH